MADLGEEKNVTGVFGGVEWNINDNNNNNNLGNNFNNQQNQEQVEEKAGVFGGVGLEENESHKINAKDLPTKIGFWAKFKAFWLQDIDWNKEIKVELTPYQQKVEDEINEFLHQEITWKKFHDFLFQDITLSK